MSVSADDADGAQEVRGVAAFEPTRSALDRDQSAQLRDLSATARDRAAEVRDRAAARREDTVAALAGGDSPLAAVLAAGAAVRRQAAADRAQAAEDRRGAAADRIQAAADRRQSRIDLARAHVDSLTGVFTRQLGLVTMGHEIDRARRSGEPFSLAYIDVDGMKDRNDNHGHAAGDALLQAVVRVLRVALRPYDPIVRVGGDEFVCGLINTELKAARRRVEEIQALVRADPAAGTISAGLARLGAHGTLGELIADADGDMYRRRAASRRPTTGPEPGRHRAHRGPGGAGREGHGETGS